VQREERGVDLEASAERGERGREGGECRERRGADMEASAERGEGQRSRDGYKLVCAWGYGSTNGIR
jgi:hypothetical protein